MIKECKDCSEGSLKCEIRINNRQNDCPCKTCIIKGICSDICHPYQILTSSIDELVRIQQSE
jgi:hypothetical protein